MAALTWFVAIALVPFAISCAGTGGLIGVLRHHAPLDVPNERSLHVMPTPRGGGIALVGAILASWVFLYARGFFPSGSFGIVIGAAGLAVVCWVDDLRGLSAAVRLTAQVAAVVAGMWALPQGLVFQGWLPPWMDALAAGLLWVWFVNLFNFMDGIDGLAASEATAIGAGLFLVGNLGIAALAAPIVAASLGFLLWNWSPARIFLGDVGSVPLGYLLGFLLYKLALQGRWQAALILPLYFLIDATWTLLRRLARGERPWQAHREHLYQRAVQRGLSHHGVVLRVIVADTVLIGCAMAASPGLGGLGTAALGGAALTVALLLIALGRGSRRA